MTIFVFKLKRCFSAFAKLLITKRRMLSTTTTTLMTTTTTISTTTMTTTTTTTMTMIAFVRIAKKFPEFFFLQ